MKSAICNMFLTREITADLKIHFVKFTKQSVHMTVTVVIGRDSNTRTTNTQREPQIVPGII